MTHKLGVGSVIVVLSAALFGVGCAQKVNFGTNSLNNIPSGAATPVVNVPACEINMAQLEFQANVNSFEFQDSFGVTFGYNPNGNDMGLGGSASIQVSKASMSLSMQGANPLAPNTALVSATVSSDQTSTNLNTQIDFSQFNVSPNYYTSTPLSTVSQNGLNKGVSGIKSQYDKVSWIGRVIQNFGGSVMINGGFVTGIAAGDTFSIYNVQHIWADMTQPCVAGNTYYGSQHVPSAPVATITITQVDPSSNVAFANVNLANIDTPIILGAEVIPLNLVTPAKGQPARYLKKNAVVGAVAAKSFDLPGGGSFDFGSAVNGQFRNAVSSGGFVVVN